VIQKALRLEPIPPDIYFQQLALVYFQTGDCVVLARFVHLVPQVVSPRASRRRAVRAKNAAVKRTIVAPVAVSK